MRRGYAHAQAEEITQEFFVALLTKDGLAQLSREGGRFRSFLLTAVKNFLANIWDKQVALKRGGGAGIVSIDQAGFRESLEGAVAFSEAIYDREWAMLVLERTTRTLEQGYATAGKSTLFQALREKLRGDRTGRPYTELASELQMSAGSLKVAVHRMRGRFREILKEEIARTVQSEAEVQDEVRYLLRVVSQ
jgi:RNA polymerase sigma-70 factor (ECF subfamily)